ncbi:MAG TPA: carbohydrate binding domain-containing protein [Sedimentisphaerales bacterium]|nr:carbohydrate binding domain-containing protein [Sedimentisphaerales bacterium]
MIRRRLASATTIWLALLTGLAAQGQDFVPFAIPLQVNTEQTIWLKDYRPIPVDSERLIAHNGHFYQGEQRVRIWGVNLCFGANFPTHEDAPKVAIRLASAGVNSVRLHHMDTSRWPAGIWSRDGRTLEPQALDRLDFFINELAQRGIFINVNLHVGHKHSEVLGLPTTNREFDKIYGIFTPALVEAQRRFARDVLTRMNPYRKVRYADDPAVAFVEITNENSFFMWDADDTLRTLPPYYADILRGQFSSWLAKRYASDEALAKAWGRGTEPLGEQMLQNGTFTDWQASRTTPVHWDLEQHEGCGATLSRPQGTPEGMVQVEVTKANGTPWHLQLTQGGLKVTEGRYYTLSFEAVAPTPRRIGCTVSQAHSPWANLGLSQNADLSTERQTFQFGFIATAGDDNARVGFAFSGDATQFQIGRVTLRPGGQVGLAQNESISGSKVQLFQDNESSSRILDRMIFLAQTEKAYFDDMRSFIRKDLGCGALVTGTIVFGPLGQYAQSDMDFIDSHAYWQHPTFPGRAWDSSNWLIEQKPMTDHPQQATLFRIAAERLLGKPFTLSEYNHPAPLDSQVECVPMVASFAAAQDWDGIWLFTYSHATDNWGRETMSGFFDMDTNPAKWGFMRAGTSIFRDRAMSPLGSIRPMTIAGGPGDMAALAPLHIRHGGNMLSGLTKEGSITYQDLLRTRAIPCYGLIDVSGGYPTSLQATWHVDAEGKGFYQVVDGQAKVCAGHVNRFEEETKGAVRLAAPEWVTLTMTPLDSDARILVTASGRCENVGMQFSPDRRTVGRNWGKAPAQIEAVRGTVVLPDGNWTCHALAPDGAPKRQVPITLDNGRPVLAMSPEYGTMWYLLERQTK